MKAISITFLLVQTFFNICLAISASPNLYNEAQMSAIRNHFQNSKPGIISHKRKSPKYHNSDELSFLENRILFDGKDYFAMEPKACLGRGACGKVKTAINLETNERVAVKVHNDKKNYLQVSFKDEHEMLKHAGMAKSEFVHGKPHKKYFAMQLINGETAENHLQKVDKRKRAEAFKEVEEKLLQAYESLVKKDIQHNDFHLNNILIDKDGNAIPIDFGFATKGKLLGYFDNDKRVIYTELFVRSYRMLGPYHPLTFEYFQKSDERFARYILGSSLRQYKRMLRKHVLDAGSQSDKQKALEKLHKEYEEKHQEFPQNNNHAMAKLSKGILINTGLAGFGAGTLLGMGLNNDKNTKKQ